jgi:hypothetical protein
MGDTGEGSEGQQRVADAVRELCTREGCDFVLLLGDNIYESGPESVEDMQWETKFEAPYRAIDLPFYAALGNHDYGGTVGPLDFAGVGNEFGKGPIEVEYSSRSEKWVMPATHYTFRWGNVGFIMLDTNSILWESTENGDQELWYPTALMEVAGAEWVIVAGHHPYRSNGSHGNAGSYESLEIAGVPVPNPVPILNGRAVQRYFDDVVCGTADLYLAGHDHNRQWLDEPDALCGAELIVSGAGAKTTELRGRGNRSHFEDDSSIGFLYVVVEGSRLTGRFVDADGATNFERTLVH